MSKMLPSSVPPKSQDWESRRKLIRTLYLNEKRTLKEVMFLMGRDHGFKASIKMYKDKVSQWGLDKKNKEREVKAIVRKRTIRAAAGKNSQFRLRGRLVDLKDIERYIKRKSSVVDVVIEAAQTPPGLECLTPASVPSSPRSPQAHNIPEFIFKNIRDYILGSFGGGTWVADKEMSDCISIKEKGNEMTALKSLFSHHDVACRLLDKGSFVEAGRMLINASAPIKDILSAEHPRTMAALFDLAMFTREKKRPELSIILIQQFASMAEVMLPESHPLARICKHLTLLDAMHFESMITTAWRSVLDLFERVLGQMHYSTLRCRIEYVQMVECKYGLERAEMILKGLVLRCKTSCGPTDVRTLKLLDTLGENLVDQEKWPEAEEVAREIVAHAPSVEPRSKAIDLSVAGLFLLARVHHHEGKRAMAEASLRQAVDLNVSEWGWQHALTLKYLLHLEEWQTEWGMVDRAVFVKERRLQLLYSSDDL